MKSGYRSSAKCDESIQDLYDQLSEAYGSLALLLKSPGEKPLPPHLADEIRELCGRIEELLALLELEEEDPQLSMSDLSSGKETLLSQVMALSSDIERIKSSIRAHSR